MAQQKNIFQIRGTIDNPEITKLYLSYLTKNKSRIIDSSIVKDRLFKFKGNLTNATEMCLYTYMNQQSNKDSIGICFFLEPIDVEIYLPGDRLDKVVVNESLTKQENNEHQKAKDFLVKKRFKLRKELDSLEALLQQVNDIQEKQKRISILKIGLDSVWNEEIDMDIQFVKTHKNSFYSLDVLNFRLEVRPERPSCDSISNLYNSLSEMVKKSDEGEQLKDKIELIKRNQIGLLAGEFELSDINGVVINKSILENNKYVLLDFWASWCIPCRQEFPSLKELYKDYHNKGFEIISISNDKDTLAYKDAVYKEGIYIWKNTLINEQIFKTFYIPVLPTKYLLDKNGIIIGKWRGGGSENMNSLRGILEKKL